MSDIEGQLSLFDTEEKPDYKVIDGGKKTPTNDLLKCYKSELLEVVSLSKDELFSGFDTIKAITFSYNIDFIADIMKHFKYGEIILGADFLVEKDSKMTNLFTEVCANVYEAGQSIKSHDNLVKMVQNGDVVFRTPKFVLDHRKLFLLKSDNGNVRTIMPSANMSYGGFNNSHNELYNYDNGEFCYDEYCKDFETAWDNSEDIPFSILSSKKSDNLVEGNALLNKVKETQKAIVVKQNKSDDPYVIQMTKYVIDHEKVKENYQVIIGNTLTNVKNGIIEIKPKIVEKIESNNHMLSRKREIKIENKTEDYPSLTFNYDTKEAFLNNEKMDLNPSEADVRHDIDILHNVFDNFDSFIDPDGSLKFTHFKLLNTICASPFFAKIRCTAFLSGIADNVPSLPMVALEASSTSNSGKTFMPTLILKMMTGKEITPFRNEDFGKAKGKYDYKEIQAYEKGIPMFIDEIDGLAFSRLKNLIKYPEVCEKNLQESQPLLIFASNNITEPEEACRKRMAFFKYSAMLPSSIDQNAFKSQGNAIIKKIGTGFYREYLRKMINEINNLIDFMSNQKDIPDTWYPDIFNISSKVIISILSDYNYDIPEYAKVLTWNEDYFMSPGNNAIAEISKEYKENRNAFQINKNSVIIILGDDSQSKKKFSSWINTLPAEIQARPLAPSEGLRKIEMNRKELEKKLGFRFSTFSLFSRGK